MQTVSWGDLHSDWWAISYFLQFFLRFLSGRQNAYEKHEICMGMSAMAICCCLLMILVRNLLFLHLLTSFATIKNWCFFQNGHSELRKIAKIMKIFGVIAEIPIFLISYWCGECSVIGWVDHYFPSFYLLSFLGCLLIFTYPYLTSLIIFLLLGCYLHCTYLQTLPYSSSVPQCSSSLGCVWAKLCVYYGGPFAH